VVLDEGDVDCGFGGSVYGRALNGTGVWLGLVSGHLVLLLFSMLLPLWWLMHCEALVALATTATSVAVLIGIRGILLPFCISLIECHFLDNVGQGLVSHGVLCAGTPYLKY
jgi:hypothetical protein